jgi:hypothetical protein
VPPSLAPANCNRQNRTRNGHPRRAADRNAWFSRHIKEIAMKTSAWWFGVCAIVATANVWAAYADEVLADNPVAYYRFEESTGTTAADSTANANNGTYVNGALLNQASATNLGRAVLLDGVSAYIDTPNTVGGNFSLELWLKTTAPSLGGSQAYQGNGLLWSDVAGSANDFVLAQLNNHAAFFTGNPDTTTEGSAVLNDGSWHHVVATRALGGATQLFVDGKLQASGTSNGNLLADNNRIAIGGNVLDSRYFSGLVDEVAYYPSVLSAARIQAHYLAGIAAQPVPALDARMMLLLMGAVTLLGLGCWRRVLS